MDDKITKRKRKRMDSEKTGSESTWKSKIVEGDCKRRKRVINLSEVETFLNWLQPVILSGALD